MRSRVFKTCIFYHFKDRVTEKEGKTHAHTHTHSETERERGYLFTVSLPRGHNAKTGPSQNQVPGAASMQMQNPKYSGHLPPLSQMHQQAGGLELKQLELKQVTIKDACTTDGSFIHYTTMPVSKSRFFKLSKHNRELFCSQGKLSTLSGCMSQTQENRPATLPEVCPKPSPLTLSQNKLRVYNQERHI